MVRVALVSDIHGNLTALQAIFDHLSHYRPIDAVWCLGDVVGYGPDPNECIEFLRLYDLRCVAGNHDLASVGSLDVAEFNPDARSACRWTMGRLTKENREFLLSLPQQVNEGDFTLVHGSPRDPIWEYVLSPSQAKSNLRDLPTPVCFVGHSHVPALYVYSRDDDVCIARELLIDEELELAGLNAKYLINPGSVGQPRDGDPRASYALLDNETATLLHFRIPYDIGAVQRRMSHHCLPNLLIERLGFGW